MNSIESVLGLKVSNLAGCSSTEVYWMGINLYIMKFGATPEACKFVTRLWSIWKSSQHVFSLSGKLYIVLSLRNTEIAVGTAEEVGDGGGGVCGWTDEAALSHSS